MAHSPYPEHLGFVTRYLRVLAADERVLVVWLTACRILRWTNFVAHVEQIARSGTGALDS